MPVSMQDLHPHRQFNEVERESGACARGRRSKFILDIGFTVYAEKKGVRIMTSCSPFSVAILYLL